MILCVQWNTDYGLVLVLLLFCLLAKSESPSPSWWLLSVFGSVALPAPPFSELGTQTCSCTPLKFICHRPPTQCDTIPYWHAALFPNLPPTAPGCVVNSFTVGSSSFQCANANSTFHVFRLSAGWAGRVFLPFGCPIEEGHSFGTDSAAEDLCVAVVHYGTVYFLYWNNDL